MQYLTLYKHAVQLEAELNNLHKNKHSETKLFTWSYWLVNDTANIINHDILIFHNTLLSLVFAKRIHLFN